jgi:hypothetical protein
MSETPKPRRSRAKKPVEPQVEQPIQEEQPEVDERSRRYRESEPGVYAPPPEMVALNDERYLKKDRIGKKKVVRGPGTPVTRVGLGGLNVVHQNPINYHGNIDV